MNRLLAFCLLAAMGLTSLSMAACGGRVEAEKIGSAAAGTIEMGIDPDTTGNTATTLGTLEPCVRIDVPSPAFDGVSDYNIDVYVKGDTQSATAYDASVVYAAVNDGCPAVADPSTVADPETGDQCFNSADDDGDGTTNDGCPQVGATAESGTECLNSSDDDEEATVHVAAPGTNDLIKMPGGMSMGDVPPDSDAIFSAGAVYLSGGPGTAGDGVLVRLGLDIGGSGLVTFALNPAPLSAYASQAGTHNLTLVSAQLAINQDCPALPPAPSPTATPSTPTPGTPTPLPTPPPGTILLLSGWNNTCHVGPEQPIEDALADIADHVLAVYQMRADQGFDRWFPNRPEASTITAVSPYQPLLILMSQYGFWPHEPSGTAPASVPLASGWNNVCYTGPTKSAGDASAGVAGGFVIMYRLDGGQGWSRYAPGRPEVSNLGQLNQYDTVLMLVSQGGGATWTFDP
jgi:hypothetical protein